MRCSLPMRAASRIAIGILGLAGAWHARAADATPCERATIQAIGRHVHRADLHYDPANPDDTTDADGTEVVAVACKAWPDDPSQVVAAIAYRPPGANRGGGDDATDELVVALVDPARGKVLRGYLGKIEEDAVTHLGRDSLVLDTARYRLAPGVRAFGLLVHSIAPQPHCADGGFEDELILYAPHGDGLAPVYDAYQQLWTTVSGQSCDVESFRSENASLSLAIGKGVSHGYSNLVVTARVRSDADGAPPGEHRVTQVLHYDGRSYPVEQVPTFWQSTGASR